MVAVRISTCSHINCFWLNGLHVSVYQIDREKMTQFVDYNQDVWNEHITVGMNLEENKILRICKKNFYLQFSMRIPEGSTASWDKNQKILIRNK
jgi:hypothetical protein